MGFETSGPNEAMIVSGLGYSSPAMIPGGRVWVWPCIQQIQVTFAFSLVENSEYFSKKMKGSLDLQTTFSM